MGPLKELRSGDDAHFGWKGGSPWVRLDVGRVRFESPIESACSGRLSHVPSQQAVIPSPRGLLSRDQSMRRDTWNLLGTSGNVFDNPQAPIDSVSTPYRGMRPSTAGLKAGIEEQNRDTLPTPIFSRRPSTRNALFPAEGVCPQKYSVDQQRLQISKLLFDKSQVPEVSANCL